MKASDRRNSKLEAKKFFATAMDSSQNWLNSTKYYSSNILFKILTLAGIERNSIERQCQLLKDLEDESDGTFYPSPDTLMDLIKQKYGSLSSDALASRVATILQQRVAELPLFNLSQRPRVQLALDLHDEEYYGKTILEEDGKRLVFYTNKHGKSGRALRYATLSIVAINNDCHQPLTIGFGVNYIGQSRADVVKKLLNQINLDFKIDLLLMDGGFTSIGVVNYLDRNLIPWAMRGSYYKTAFYHAKPGLSHFFPHHLGGYPVAAYFIETRSPDGNIGYILLISSILKLMSVAKIKQLYRRRFRIENTYRHARVTKIRTSSRHIQLRWLLWAIAHFLELLWELIRFALKEQGFDDEMCRQSRILWIWRNQLYDGLRKVKFPLTEELNDQGGD